MHEIINEKVSVVAIHNVDRKALMPFKIQWRGRIYYIKKLGYHHTVRDGKVLNHIFSVTDGNMAFRLKFNTDNLSWTLEEVSDGYSA
jgi:hypothetical protein